MSISARWISNVFADFVLPFLCATLWIFCVSSCWVRNKIRSNEVNVKRERLTQIVLVIVGLLNLAMIYFLYMELRHSSWLLVRENEVEPMFLSFFIPVGVFLLVAARRPSEHRSMIALVAWWNISHGVVMAIQTVEARIHTVHRNFTDVIVYFVIGGVLLALLPAKREAVAQEVA
ncbi:MAG: DUF6632 domain-containing protein [Candidatus Acidiferrum sp.]